MLLLQGYRVRGVTVDSDDTQKSSISNGVAQRVHALS